MDTNENRHGVDFKTKTFCYPACEIDERIDNWLNSEIVDLSSVYVRCDVTKHYTEVTAAGNSDTVDLKNDVHTIDNRNILDGELFLVIEEGVFKRHLGQPPELLSEVDTVWVLNGSHTGTFWTFKRTRRSGKVSENIRIIETKFAVSDSNVAVLFKYELLKPRIVRCLIDEPFNEEEFLEVKDCLDPVCQFSSFSQLVDDDDLFMVKGEDASRGFHPPAWSAEKKRFEEFIAGFGGNTARSYSQDWKVFAEWYREVNDEEFDLRRLSSLDVGDFKRWSLTEGRAASTVNRRLAFLKKYSSYGLKTGVLKQEIHDSIRSVKGVPKQTLAPKSLPVPVVRKLLKELELRGSSRDKAIIYSILFSGLRVGELVALNRDDLQISERKGAVNIRSEISKRGKEREVPLPLEARRHLRAYLKSRMDSEQAVFVGQRGRLKEDAVNKLLSKYSNGVHITPHLLRHTFAYRYLEQNDNDLVGLAAILGHDDLNTTRIYTQKRLEDLQEGVEAVNYFDG